MVKIMAVPREAIIQATVCVNPLVFNNYQLSALSYFSEIVNDLRRRFLAPIEIQRFIVRDKSAAACRSFAHMFR